MVSDPAKRSVSVKQGNVRPSVGWPGAGALRVDFLGAVALAALAVACGPALEDSSSIDEDVPFDAVGVVEQAARSRQGEKLQGGAQESSFVWLPVPGVPRATDPLGPSGARLDSLTVAYGQLVGSMGGRRLETPALVGAIFYGQNQRTGAALKFLVEGFEVRPTPAGAAPQYELKVRVTDSSTGASTALCGDGPSDRAIVAPGSWDVHGAAHARSDRFTFACTSGVIDKCVRWGYRYYEPLYASHHQACTRMARADYCGDGTPHTVAGTLVDLFDRRGVEGDARFLKPDPTGPVLSFEAGWSVKGGAVCLSKLRWSTLPIGGHCPLKLPDPRVVPVQKDPRARYCEEYGRPSDGLPFLVALEREGALVFNDSAYLDAGLYLWTHAATGERFSTTRGLFAPARATVSPAPGYSAATFVGAVYRRGADPGLLPREIAPLSLWHNAATGDYLTSTQTPSALGLGGAYALVGVEGFVLKPDAPLRPAGARKLWLYKHPATGDFATGVVRPGPAWVPVRHEGWLPR